MEALCLHPVGLGPRLKALIRPRSREAGELRRGSMVPKATSRTAWLPFRDRVLIAAVLAFGLFPRGASSGESPPPAHWRTQPYCGVNAAYVLLKMNGNGVTHSQLREEIPVTEAGCSMKAIRDALVKHNLEARIVRARPEQLASLQLPAIAHLETDSSARFHYDNRGHYVVLFDVRPNDVRYIDGTTGVIMTVDTNEFVTNWSGYLLITDSIEAKLVRNLPMGVGVVCISLITLVLVRRHRLVRTDT